MNSKWQASKIGLVDFWYYDTEEFDFSEGRMLLRGANGSGKSVTMQSFIPLLLDGNMRPERLDPFGSRARRMENYLLEENDEREERTGYLYMEFKREESETYLTIGMGMRARKNKKMESWYFILTDGRRVNVDFALYKEVGSKVVLTKRELRNRIGEGGQVYESQNEYMEAVNRYLFGFETSEEYKEMIDLLIQLRTPKLSKDFKPSIINEILSSSLQTLSEEDLRPMSEAIENMDGLKTNVDNLKNSIEAAGKIERIYDRYNRAVLLEKAELFQGQCERQERLGKKAQEQRQKGKELEELCSSLTAQMFENKQEESLRKEELASLNASDVTLLKNQELELQEKLKGQAGALEGKRAQIEQKEESWRELSDKLKQQQEQAEVTQTELEELLDEMEEQVQEQSFEEHEYMASELRGQLEEEYSFDAHKVLLKQRLGKIEEAVEKLKTQRRVQEELDERLRQLDLEKEKQEKAERNKVHYGTQFSEIKSESVEKLYRWEQENQELKLEKETLQRLATALEQYGEQMDFSDIREIVHQVKQKLEEVLQGEKRKSQGLEEQKSKELEAAREELRAWEEMEEPEPEVTEAVRKNREALREAGISYIQFYQAIEYPKGMSEEQQNYIEEALSEMGILDALIVSEEDREQILKLDAGLCDRYLFSDVEKVKGNLEDLLEIDNVENDILFYQKVSRALSGIAYQNLHHTAIYEDGSYRIGAVSGTITREYTSRFIGAQARARYRDEQIQRMKKVIRELKKEYDGIHAEVEAWTARIELLNQEYTRFLSEDDLKTAYRDYQKACQELQRIQENVAMQKEKTQEILTRLNAIRMETQALCESVHLTMSLNYCEEALKDLKAYAELLTSLEIQHHSYLETGRRIADLRERLEDADADLDHLRYDLGKLEQENQAMEKTLSSVREQLKLTNYDEIKERMDLCTERLSKLPEEYTAMAAKKAASGEKQRGIEEELRKSEAEIARVEEVREFFKKVFFAEWKLGYVELPEGEASQQNPQQNGQEAGLALDVETLSQKICRQLQAYAEHKPVQELLGDLQSVYHENRALLVEYQLAMEHLFGNVELPEAAAASLGGRTVTRIDLAARYAGIKVNFKELLVKLQTDREEQEALLGDKDRELFEDILANTISKKIRAKIYKSNQWVAKMNELMGSMKTSSGLTLSLKWRSKSAEHEGQLSTYELVELLKKDSEIMREEEVAKLSKHFRSKIAEARKILEQENAERSFHAIMREVLDYRKWFTFQLECQKTGENKKELTDRVFFTFSGGEKAMSMYVPLFSAVVAKYDSADGAAPRLVSLDEAFAGVDEMNIKDMFRLMVEFEFNFIINSQILYGDYDTVPQLAIYQLIRPENAKYVSVIRYYWDGNVRNLVTGG